MYIFKIFSGEHAPGLPRVFLFFNKLQISFAEKKNTLQKYAGIMPPGYKISHYPTACTGTVIVSEIFCFE